MIAECPPENALTQEDINHITKMSGPITLARHEANPAFYRSVTIIRSGMLIEQHRGHFFAHRTGGPVLALEGDIGELLQTLWDLDLL